MQNQLSFTELTLDGVHRGNQEKSYPGENATWRKRTLDSFFLPLPIQLNMLYTFTEHMIIINQRQCI